MGSGGISHTRLLLLLVNLFPFGNLDNPCHKSYRQLYYRKIQGSFFTGHTLINQYCYDSSKLETSQQNGQTFWAVENSGQGGQRLGSRCQKGERWVCFLKGGIQDLINNQDFIKEQIIRKLTKQIQQSNPEPASHEDLYTNSNNN